MINIEHPAITDVLPEVVRTTGVGDLTAQAASRKPKCAANETEAMESAAPTYGMRRGQAYRSMVWFQSTCIGPGDG